VDAIHEWIDEHNPDYVVVWNGNDEFYSKELDELLEADSGFLELFAHRHKQFLENPMDIRLGDWIVKSGRDTFYSVQKEDFNEIWEVLG
jgi:ABC-type Fe3+-hydroxamate transport system substrate-binding protein